MKIKSFLIILFVYLGSLNAQNTTTVTATDEDISKNLDLEAVATVFGESKDLEDFENKLNNPDLMVSNLDLNHDNEIDYLRVLTESQGNTNVVTIQAVLGQDQYQDVATIDVEKVNSTTQVQVIGDTYIYGPQYIIEPVYVSPPVIFTWFWGPYYRPWLSPFYWGHYPPYFRPWHPYPPHRYHSNINVNINVHRNSYHHTTVRKSPYAKNMGNKHKRNDYAHNNPKPSHPSNGNGNGGTKPHAKKPPTSPAMKPATKPSTRQATTRPTNTTATRPATTQTTSSVTRPTTTARTTSYPTTKQSTTRTTTRQAPRNVARPATTKSIRRN